MRGVLIGFMLGASMSIWAQNFDYYEDIAPVLEQKCVGCHQEGQIGPMPLTNYEEVAAYGAMIAFVTKKRWMPPWLAAGPEEIRSTEHQLSDSEIQLIENWVSKGMPRAEKAEKELLAVLPAARYPTWEPDLQLGMAEAFEQYGIYYDQYKVFVIPTHLNRDVAIDKVAFIPGNPEIIRGVIISIDTSDTVDRLDAWDPQYGYFSFGGPGFVPSESQWFSWLPGQEDLELPLGMAKLLPKGAKLIVHIHYGPTGVPQKDSSAIWFSLAEQPIERWIQTVPLIHPYTMTNDSFILPANEVSRVHATFTIPYDLDLWGLYPMAHFLGQKWEVFAVEPSSQSARRLLKIEEWDFHWKQGFRYKESIRLTAGTTVHALATYNNTPDNLFNPSDPPRTMHWGKRMYEETFLVHFDVSQVHSSKAAPPVQIKPFPSLVCDTTLVIGLEVISKGLFDCALVSFSGEMIQDIVSNQLMEPGTYARELNLANLSKGNYYLRCHSLDTGYTTHRILVYVDENLFD